MKNIILEKLQEVEKRENVRIIYAAESGSRAWGFASPDSDYDVRFLYVRHLEDYLCIDPPCDVIEWQLDETLDINGWDIQKALRLLRKSNPTLFEWGNSPIIYRNSETWMQLQQIMNSYFSSKEGMYHYLSMAKRNYHEFLMGETVRTKKYLYVLRPILACKWVYEKQTPPPMQFDELVSAELDFKVAKDVEQLLDVKKTSAEIKTIPRIQTLNDYIEEQLTLMLEIVKSIPAKESKSDKELNTVFQTIVFGG